MVVAPVALVVGVPLPGGEVTVLGGDGGDVVTPGLGLVAGGFGTGGEVALGAGGVVPDGGDVGGGGGGDGGGDGGEVGP